MVKQSQSFAKIFSQPTSHHKNASFSQWPVCTSEANTSMCMACTGPKSSRARISSMGYSIRTDEWRLTIWLPFNTTVFVVRCLLPAARCLLLAARCLCMQLLASPLKRR